jgi:hypothetical protein
LNESFLVLKKHSSIKATAKGSVYEFSFEWNAKIAEIMEPANQKYLEKPFLSESLALI